LDLIATYFKTEAAYKNHFYPAAPRSEIADAEELLGISLPDDYRGFLLLSNGFEGFINQSYLRLIPVGFLYENTQDYCSEFFPWAIYLGTNGGGEMAILDTRKQPFQFGLLPYLGVDEDFISLGETFESFIRSIYNDEVFD
jgi:hypothetical protein